MTPRIRAQREHLGELADMIADIPGHRVDDAVSTGVLLEAGILSGLVFRLGGFQPGQEVAALNDATIYLHALERGLHGPDPQHPRLRLHEPNHPAGPGVALSH